MKAEGVTKFSARHRVAALDGDGLREALANLAAWRSVLAGLDLIGRDPARYDGAGYGNLSVRVPPWTGGRGARPFLVSGTQTGHLGCVTPEDFCRVEGWDIEACAVTSTGPVPPSSESMTHGALYDLSPHIRAVVHVHAPAIFARTRALRLPATPHDVEYGTPAMARAVGTLWRDASLSSGGSFVMAGHEDGVVSIGASLDEAGGRMVALLARALACSVYEAGAACAPRAR